MRTEFKIAIDDEILVQQFEDEWQEFVDVDALEQVADRSKLRVLLERGICSFFTQDDFPGAGLLNRKTDLSSNPPPMPGLPPPPPPLLLPNSLTLIGALLKMFFPNPNPERGIKIVQSSRVAFFFVWFRLLFHW